MRVLRLFAAMGLTLLFSAESHAQPSWIVLDASSFPGGGGTVYRVFEPSLKGGFVESTFTLGDEGWAIADNATSVPDHDLAGGNPGGFIRAEDSQGVVAYDFVAPGAFAGNQGDKIGGSISWDWIALGSENDAGTLGNEVGTLRIRGGGSPVITVDVGVGQPRAGVWTSESISLVPASFSCVSGCTDGRKPPTPGEFQDLMEDIDEIRFRGDWFLGLGSQDRTGIDNVRLKGPPVGVGPEIVSPQIGGNLLTDPFGLAVEASGYLLVTDPNAQGATGALMRVHPTTGAQSTVSSGGNFVTPLGVAVETTGAAVIADANALGGAVIRVDTASGVQSVVSSGGVLTTPVGVAVEANGDLLIVDRQAFGGSGGVVRIDPASGLQTPLSSGGEFVDPVGILIESSGDILIADPNASERKGAIIRLDPVTGDQTVLASGRHFVDPISLALHPEGGIVVVDTGAGAELSGKGALIHVDLATGAQTLLGSGAPFRDPIAVPEPGPLVGLLGGGMLLLFLAGRRRPDGLRAALAGGASC